MYKTARKESHSVESRLALFAVACARASWVCEWRVFVSPLTNHGVLIGFTGVAIGFGLLSHIVGFWE